MLLLKAVEKGLTVISKGQLDERGKTNKKNPPRKAGGFSTLYYLGMLQACLDFLETSFF